MTLQNKSSWHTNEFDKPLLVASYFGFMPIEAPKVSRRDLEMVRDCGQNPIYNAGERTALVRMCLEQNFAPEDYPVSVSYKLSRGMEKKYGLHYVGTPSTIAESVLIQAALAILEESGHKNLRIDLNCVGDRESLSAYEKELLNHLKKHVGDLPEEHRERLKKDVFDIFDIHDEALAGFKESMPSALSSLTSSSREYFKEILEHIEALGVEFNLESRLVGDKHFCSHTIFAVRDKNAGDQTRQEDILAIGYRYSRLSKRFGMKKELPMVGVSIFPGNKRKANAVVKNPPRTKFCLVHLGRDARMQSIPLIEQLRRERIRLHHDLVRDKLAIQLAYADTLGASHLIVIGQKEALDKTATVRNVSTRAQETIDLRELARYLKRIPI